MTALNYMLIEHCTGEASTRLQSYDTQNSFEIWRLFCHHYGGSKLQKMYSLYSKVMNWTFRKDHFEQDFVAWELAQREYFKATGKDIEEEMLVTVLLTKTPPPLNEHLALQASKLKDYYEFKRCIEEYYGTQKLISNVKNLQVAKTNDAGGLANMDIGAMINALHSWRKKNYYKNFKGGKTKGKGKSKGGWSHNYSKGSGFGKGKPKGWYHNTKGKGKGKNSKGKKGKRKGTKGKRSRKGKGLGQAMPVNALTAGGVTQSGCQICWNYDHCADACPYLMQQLALDAVASGNSKPDLTKPNAQQLISAIIATQDQQYGDDWDNEAAWTADDCWTDYNDWSDGWTDPNVDSWDDSGWQDQDWSWTEDSWDNWDDSGGDWYWTDNDWTDGGWPLPDVNQLSQPVQGTLLPNVGGLTVGSITNASEIALPDVNVITPKPLPPPGLEPRIIELNTAITPTPKVTVATPTTVAAQPKLVAKKKLAYFEHTGNTACCIFMIASATEVTMGAMTRMGNCAVT